jgi:hypothetical protein
MSCVEPTQAMLDLLKALRAWSNVDTAELRDRSEWAQATRWGWVMPSGELTGRGLRHLRELARGIVRD